MIHVVHMEVLKQLWKTCLRRSWLEDVVHRASAEIKTIKMEANTNPLQNKQVDCSKNDLQELSFEEKLQASLINWGQASSNLTSTNIDEGEFCEHIYANLSNIALKPEIVKSVIIGLKESENTNPVIVFRKLEDFYRRWCNGEFIDAAPDNNLPQKQMLQLQAQNIAIGVRQVDINTGLNVMILLLELHRLLEKQNHNQETKISFYPCEKPSHSNFFTSRLLRVINYSDSIEIGNFINVVGAFLQGAQLNGVYLGDANLSHGNFSDANLSGAYLGDANLIGIQANKVNLKDANLCDANLSGAELKEGNLTNCDLTHCNLSGADLSGANLTNADLGDANLSGANLTGANLAGANLTSANLRDATLDGANLKNAILFGANLSDTNLIGTEISYADLCRADLSGSNLRGSTLKGTNLSDSILFSTNLTEAILHAADLSYAKLNGANLGGANLRGVTMSSVDLGGVNLSGVSLHEANLNSADLRETVLLGTDLSDANLHNANLSGSNLSSAILTGADLSHTNLSYAILDNADLGKANLENITYNKNLEWEKVRGLEEAINVPQALKKKLGLM